MYTCERTLFSQSGIKGAAVMALMFTLVSLASAQDDDARIALGQSVSPERASAQDLSITPDGVNLPEGSGTPEQGKAVYEARCASCHGPQGSGGEGLADPLVGGTGTLGSPAPVKTVGSYWPYATTLFDYTRRAMPLDAPLSLSDDEVYAVSAYLLSLNGIIDGDAVMNAQTLPEVEMPNREGFVSQWPGYSH